jgi:hypothetical protein
VAEEGAALAALIPSFLARARAPPVQCGGDTEVTLTRSMLRLLLALDNGALLESCRLSWV